MDSNDYILKFCNSFWQNNIGVHCTIDNVLLGAVDVKSQIRLLPDTQFLRDLIDELNLNDNITQYIMLDNDFIVGFGFSDEHSKKSFEEHIMKLSEDITRYVIIKEENKCKVQIRINAFPPSFSKSMLQEKLGAFGEITDFEYATENRYGNQWKSNNLIFKLKILQDVNVDNLPCFVWVRGYPLMLMAKGLPPVCHKCKVRGHKAKDCSACFCRDCHKVTSFIHNCVSIKSPAESRFQKLQNRQQNLQQSQIIENQHEIPQFDIISKNSEIQEKSNPVETSYVSNMITDNSSDTDNNMSSELGDRGPPANINPTVTLKNKRKKRKLNKNGSKDQRDNQHTVLEKIQTDSELLIQENYMETSNQIKTVKQNSKVFEDQKVKGDIVPHKFLTNNESQIKQDHAKTSNQTKRGQKAKKPMLSMNLSKELNELYDIIKIKIEDAVNGDEIQQIIKDCRLNNPDLHGIKKFCNIWLRKFQLSEDSSSDDSGSDPKIEPGSHGCKTKLEVLSWGSEMATSESELEGKSADLQIKLDNRNCSESSELNTDSGFSECFNIKQSHGDTVHSQLQDIQEILNEYSDHELFKDKESILRKVIEDIILYDKADEWNFESLIPYCLDNELYLDQLSVAFQEK